MNESVIQPGRAINAVATMYFDFNGRLIRYFSTETSVEYAAKIEGMEPRRFEYRFVEVPNPFDVGDKVAFAGSDGRDKVYTVATSHEDWMEFLEKVKTRNFDDWSDASIIIRASSDPIDHDHVNPIYLELASEEIDWGPDVGREIID